MTKLITSATLRAKFGNVSDMTIWRWQRAKLIPEPIKIRNRRYWDEGKVNAALEKLAGGANPAK